MNVVLLTIESSRLGFLHKYLFDKKFSLVFVWHLHRQLVWLLHFNCVVSAITNDGHAEVNCGQ